MVVGAIGQLARCPSIRRDDEQVLVPERQKPLTVDAVDEPFIRAGGRSPLRPLGLRRQLGKGFRRRRLKHAEGDSTAIR